jgi:hypothetical protein
VIKKGGRDTQKASEQEKFKTVFECDEFQNEELDSSDNSGLTKKITKHLNLTLLVLI